MRDPVEIKVAGKSYRIHASDDGADLFRVAEFVNARIRDIRKAAPGISAERAAILAALNVGDELLREREAVTDAVDAVRGRAREIEARWKGAGEKQEEESA